MARLKHLGLETNPGTTGRLPTVAVPGLDATIAEGGFGKSQFAVQTQHLIDAGPNWDVVICAGVSGALDTGVRIGDIVVGTETVEHDIYFSTDRPRPRFGGSEPIITELQSVDMESAEFNIYFGAIASGDEAVIATQRRAEVQAITGALAVAWEGAGGARAAEFSNLPFVELRGISDMADQSLGSDFFANIPITMQNIAEFVSTWCGIRP